MHLAFFAVRVSFMGVLSKINGVALSIKISTSGVEDGWNELLEEKMCLHALYRWALNCVLYLF